MKKPKDPTLVIYGACALIWTILTLMKIPGYMQDNSIILLILNAVCAVLWIIAFMLRYRELRRNQQTNSTQKQEGES